MNTLLIIIFVIAYTAIALEHPLKVNKAAPALIGAGLLWTIYAITAGSVTEQLNETLSSTAQIIFFLMGAMTIVEVVDAPGCLWSVLTAPCIEHGRARRFCFR